MSKPKSSLQVWILLASTAVLSARAANIETLTVQRDHKLINVVASMIIEAPRPFVYQALSDYDHFSEMSDSFIESRFIEPAADGTPRIYTKIEGCIWFFCRTINRTARLELDPIIRIVATVEPHLSDAKYAREEWVFEDLGAATRIYYRHDLQPNFWVPPGIGVWAISSVLSRTTLKAAQRIEKMAIAKQQADDGSLSDTANESANEFADESTIESAVDSMNQSTGAAGSKSATESQDNAPGPLPEKSAVPPVEVVSPGAAL